MATNLRKVPTGQIQKIITELQECAKNQTVLEVACGTGYWTPHIAPISRKIVSTDYSDEMLKVARGQGIAKASFVHDDAYQLTNVGSELFDVGFAMHWVSHIPLSRWDEFFTAFHARLKPGAKVMLADDIRRPDDTDPYYSKLADRDSYEVRHLPNEKSYEILKTYFMPQNLLKLLSPFADNIEIRFERPRWWLTYEVRRK